MYDYVTTKPPLNDDTLQHYGVKGMKWKQHKNTDLKYRGYPSAESGKKLTFVMDRGLLVDDHYKSANRSTNKSRPISKSKKAANKKKTFLKRKWEANELHDSRHVPVFRRTGVIKESEAERIMDNKYETMFHREKKKKKR